MKQGYFIFSKAYGVMLQNDLHDPSSIDHKLIKDMILLDKESYNFLYSSKVVYHEMNEHPLFNYAQQFKGASDIETIKNVVNFTSEIADKYCVDFDDMLFGGTEKEILMRGTDWCADMARVAAVLLDCLGVPSRIIHLANLDKAYNGHVVIEAYYEGKYGVVDPLYGYIFYDQKPLNAYELQSNITYFEGKDDDYRDMFKGIGITEYDPLDTKNVYKISRPNEYYLKLIHENHNNQWIMGEDDN